MPYRWWKSKDRTSQRPLLANLFRDVRSLFLGTAGSQLLVVLSLPIVSRLYSPSEFGVVQSIEAIAQMVMISSAISYERAFVAARSALDRNRLLYVALALACLTACVGVVISTVAFESGPGARAGDGIQIEYLMLLLLPYFFGKNIFWVLSSYANSVSLYSDTAKAELKRSIGLVACRIIFGVLQFGVWGLFVATLIGSVVGVVGLSGKTVRFWREDLKRTKIKQCINTAWMYRRFPLFEGLGEFFAVVAQRLPVVIFGFTFGAASAGYYGIALLVLNRPMAIFIGPIVTVLRTYTGINSKQPTKSETPFPIYYFYFLAIGTIVASTFFATVLTLLFPIVFGERWAAGGDLIILMLPNVLAVMILRPMLGVLSAGNQLKPVLCIQFVMLVASILPLYIGPQLLGLEFHQTIIAKSIATSIFGVICGIVAFAKLRVMLATKPANTGE